MKKTVCFIIFNLLVFQNAFSQNVEYSYRNNEKNLQTYFENITKKQLNKINGNYKKQRKEFYRNQLKGLINQLNNNTFIFNNNLNTKTNNIFDEIYRANPELINKDFQFLINKSIFPNAGAFGNGLFTINLGLFTFLDSEDEIAFVICHELAHYYLNHINKKIDNYVSKINSKEVNTKASKIRRMKYGRNSAGKELLKDLNFDFSEHSRASELEADSLGFYYFSKTKYNNNAAFTSLKKLGDLENIIFGHQVDWSLLFNLNNYRFNKTVLEKEESLFNSNTIINDYQWDVDSLKSHPDIKVRIDKLIGNEYNLINMTNMQATAKSYEKIKDLSEKVSISVMLDSGKLDLAFYLLAFNIENNKSGDLVFFIGKMIRVLNEIYILKKNHNIGKYVPQANGTSDEVYLNDIRRFIHNIDLYELKNLIKIFTDYYYDKIKNNNDLTTIYNTYNNN